MTFIHFYVYPTFVKTAKVIVAFRKFEYSDLEQSRLSVSAIFSRDTMKARSPVLKNEIRQAVVWTSHSSPLTMPIKPGDFKRAYRASIRTRVIRPKQDLEREFHSTRIAIFRELNDLVLNVNTPWNCSRTLNPFPGYGFLRTQAHSNLMIFHWAGLIGKSHKVKTEKIAKKVSTIYIHPAELNGETTNMANVITIQCKPWWNVHIQSVSRISVIRAFFPHYHLIILNKVWLGSRQ